MPKVKIQKDLNLQADKVYKSVQEILTTDPEVKALEPHLELKGEKKDNEISGEVKGSRIQGHFSIKETGESSSHIDIELSLPLILAPFKNVVDKKIQDKLNTIS